MGKNEAKDSGKGKGHPNTSPRSDALKQTGKDADDERKAAAVRVAKLHSPRQR